MSDGKLIGGPVPFEPGEMVWDKLTGRGPFVVLRQEEQKVTLYAGNPSHDRTWATGSLLAASPALTRYQPGPSPAWRARRAGVVGAVLGAAVGAVLALSVMVAVTATPAGPGRSTGFVVGQGDTPSVTWFAGGKRLDHAHLAWDGAASLCPLCEGR